MKALYVLAGIYAVIAVMLVIELINHGMSGYAWRYIFILALGAAYFLVHFIFADRIARETVRSEYSGIKQDMEKLLREMREEIYGNEDEGKEPITLDSRIIGTLTYRRKPEWYECDSKWCGSKVRVTLHQSIGKDPSAALAALEDFFRNSRRIDRILRSRVAEKKDKQFAKRIFPTNITLTSESVLELDYADSDHRILGIYNGSDMKVKIRR